MVPGHGGEGQPARVPSLLHPSSSMHTANTFVSSCRHPSPHIQFLFTVAYIAAFWPRLGLGVDTPESQLTTPSETELRIRPTQTLEAGWALFGQGISGSEYTACSTSGELHKGWLEAPCT